MFKFNRVVAVLLVCGLAGAVYAKAIKAKWLDPVGAGLTENPDGDGMAIINYHQGNDQTEITIAVTDFLPNTDYFLAATPGLSGAPVTTNNSGNANAHAFTTFDPCLFVSQVDVSVWRDLNGDFIMQADEVRAEGIAVCP